MADLVSGWLCLEFANTVDNYRREDPYDFLPDFEALVQFALRAGEVSRREAEAVRQSVELQSRRGGECLVRAKALRQSVYTTFSALAAGKDPSPEALAALNAWYARAAAHSLILPSDSGFEWGWNSADDPDRLLWPLVRSAALLLTSPELKRLRQCGGHNCTWLFLDRSKNRSRRWCTMEICGNRAKSRRHYARLRTS